MMLNLSRQTGHIKLTGLEEWQPTFKELCRAFTTPKIDSDKLNSGYFLRCAGTKRSNETVGDTAHLFILDGDSHYDVDGNIVAGAVNPLLVHMMLNHLDIDHFMYTSHSNAEGLHKYRVLIPCTYTRQQLPALLEWIFERLHENGIDLVNVKENSSWAQAWFMPCVPMERKHLFKTWWRVEGKCSNPKFTTEHFEPAQPFDVAAICQLALSPVSQSIPIRQPIAITANPIQAFNASFSVHDVLIRNGYKQQGKRYLHPTSQSGAASVRILDSGAYSDGGDVLNDGRCHDAFDCYRLLECGGDMRQALNWNSDITRANQRAFYDIKKPRDTSTDAVLNRVESTQVIGARHSFNPTFSDLTA